MTNDHRLLSIVTKLIITKRLNFLFVVLISCLCMLDACACASITTNRSDITWNSKSIRSQLTCEHSNLHTRALTHSDWNMKLRVLLYFIFYLRLISFLNRIRMRITHTHTHKSHGWQNGKEQVSARQRIYKKIVMDEWTEI